MQGVEMTARRRKKEGVQQEHGRLWENKVSEILQILEKDFEPADQEKAPVRGVHQYLNKRKDNLDYAGARAQGLPIGSGELESGHRHVIQQRLKIAGAWWIVQNAEATLRIRTTRANSEWYRYWTEVPNN